MIRRVALLSVVGLVVGATAVAAHTPTSGAGRRYTADYQSLPYKYGGSVPTWMQTAVASSLQTGWVANNNSRSPRFSFSASGAGTVWYSAMAECYGVTDWIGCFQAGTGTTWNIWVRSNGATLCERPGEDLAGCRTTKRIVLHEATHLTLTRMAPHDPQANGGTLTVMGCAPGSCIKPQPGYDATTWLECDQAAFQMKYGMQNFAGQFGNCLDHVAGAGPSGLATVSTVSQATGQTCAGLSLSRSGWIGTQDNANYGLLRDIGLATRYVHIDRKLHSSSTWTNDYSYAITTSAQSGYNWSHSFSENPAITTTYDYRIRQLGEAGISPAPNLVFSITFLKPCPPP